MDNKLIERALLEGLDAGKWIRDYAPTINRNFKADNKAIKRLIGITKQLNNKVFILSVGVAGLAIICTSLDKRVTKLEKELAAIKDCEEVDIDDKDVVDEVAE